MTRRVPSYFKGTIREVIRSEVYKFDKPTPFSEPSSRHWCGIHNQSSRVSCGFQIENKYVRLGSISPRPIPNPYRERRCTSESLGPTVLKVVTVYSEVPNDLVLFLPGPLITCLIGNGIEYVVKKGLK